MRIPTQEELEKIRREYPVGTRLVVEGMEDTQAPKPGTLGTVTGVDSLGDLLMSWDTGGSLKVILSLDSVRRATAEDEAGAKLKKLAPHQPMDRCPRCGAAITPKNRLLALSRRLDITVCENCGTFEALEDAGMAEKLPLTKWAAFKEGWA